MSKLLTELKRMKQLAGIITESSLGLSEAVASTAHIKVGEQYSYKSGTEGLPPVKIKVVKIVNDTYFVGEILEDNKTTEYKGWKKGDNYQMNVSFIEETSNKQVLVNNPPIEPKNDVGEKNPVATEAFNKLVAWAKQNKLKTVDQSTEYGTDDIYIRLWSNEFLDVIINVSKEKQLTDFLKTLGGKMSKTHMDEEQKGARIGLNFEGMGAQKQAVTSESRKPRKSQLKK